jgi:hypothetical protein
MITVNEAEAEGVMAMARLSKSSFRNPAGERCCGSRDGRGAGGWVGELLKAASGF